MDRRLALLTLAALATGCRGRVRSYDPKPQSWSLEDKWSGWYFNRVQALYSLPLHNPAASLNRDSGPPIVVGSSDSRPSFKLPSSEVAPTHADVELDYNIDETAPDEMSRKVRVTLHWPNPVRSEHNSIVSSSDSRIGHVGYTDIREFLEGTGVLRVHRREHYYGTIQQPAGEMLRDDNQMSMVVNVDLKVSGSSTDSRFSRTLAYPVPYHLYQLAKRAWPGIA